MNFKNGEERALFSRAVHGGAIRARGRAAALLRVYGLCRLRWSRIFHPRSVAHGAAPEWREHLDDLSIDELAMLLESATPPSMGSKMKAWPATLLEFFAAAHALRLPGQLKPRGGAEGSGEVQTVGKAKRHGGSVTAHGRCNEETQMATTALRVAMKVSRGHETRSCLPLAFLVVSTL